MEIPRLHLEPLENHLDSWLHAPDPDRWLQRHLLRHLLEKCDGEGHWHLVNHTGDACTVNLRSMAAYFDPNRTVVIVGWSDPGGDSRMPSDPFTWAVVAREDLTSFCEQAGVDPSNCATPLRDIVPYVKPPDYEVGATTTAGYRSFSLRPWLDADLDDTFLVAVPDRSTRDPKVAVATESRR